VNVYHTWASVEPPRKPVVLAAGFFDGVHRGHRRVLGDTLAAARAQGGEAWVLTFDRHPLRVLNPAAAPPLLTALPHKLRLLADLGLDACLALRFTRRLAAQEPERFARTLRTHVPSLVEVVVGRNWRFGRGGRGDPALLRALGQREGFRVRVAPPVCRGGRPISSTRVREAVTAGALDDAAALLGRPFSLRGTVVTGDRRGRRLGYPTANLDTHNEALPPQGVYAVHAVPAGASVGLDGVLNLGVRPTFAAAGPPRSVMELHLFGTRRVLYGRDIEVFFARLRAERAFACAAELGAQIARDIARARGVLARRHAAKKIKESLYTSGGPVYSPPERKQKGKK
jgi:riboflavin kinase / FMN adenylyltransferase